MSISSTTLPDGLDSGGCEQLSPHNRFLSTVLTSFIGAIVTGITGGWLLAFWTAWISWFATLRIVVVGIWFVSRALRGLTLDGGLPFYRQTVNQEGLELQEQALNNSAPSDTPPASDSSSNATANLVQADTPGINQAVRAAARRLGQFQKSPPTLFGWVGWVYASCYFPVVQVLWLAGNWGNGPSAWNLKIVRALSISVTALALTMDTKARYAVSVGERFGPWARHAFTTIHAFSTLTLGVVAVIMLIVGVTQLTDPNHFIIPTSVIIFIIFAVVWMHGSFVAFPPVDGGMAPNSFRTFVGGLAMGIFSGVFTSFAAFTAMQFASKDGAGISAYLKCEGVEAWHKFIAIFP